MARQKDYMIDREAQSRDLAELSDEERRSYYAFKRNRDHDEALQCARDAVAARYHEESNR